jgi:hypothetical protein
VSLARVAYERSDPELAERWLAQVSPDVATSSDIQLRNVSSWMTAVEAIGENRLADALPVLMEVVERMTAEGVVGHAETCFTDAATIAMDLRDPELASPFAAWLETVPTGQRTRPVVLACARIRANAAAAKEDHDRAAEEYGTSLAIARNLGRPALLGPVLVDYGRWLVETGRAEEAAPLLEEAREMFEGMGATRWLARLEELAPQAEAAVT